MRGERAMMNSQTINNMEIDLEIQKLKGDDYMSNREKEILNTFVEALPVMSDFDKGYVLGIAESRLKEKREIALEALQYQI